MKMWKTKKKTYCKIWQQVATKMERKERPTAYELRALAQAHAGNSAWALGLWPYALLPPKRPHESHLANGSWAGVGGGLLYASRAAYSESMRSSSWWANTSDWEIWA